MFLFIIFCCNMKKLKEKRVEKEIKNETKYYSDVSR